MECAPFSACLGDGNGKWSYAKEIVKPDFKDEDRSIEEISILQSSPPATEVISGAPLEELNEYQGTPSPKKGEMAHSMLKRGLSNFSIGSTGSRKSGRSSASSGSGSGRSKVDSAAIAKRWSQMLDVPGVPEVVKRSSMVLRDDERMLSFDEARRHGVITPMSLNDRCGGRPNKVRTTKFTPLTWLPKSLINQFKRVANIYFLFIACLVVWPWSPKNWKSKIFPFVAVLLWTALKDLFEDMRRKRDDDAENSQRCWRLKRGEADGEDLEGFEEITWAEVLCGDMLLIPEDAAFAADLILIHPAGGTEAFISTVMLDGETSLKVRQSPSLCEVMAGKCAKDQAFEWQQVQSQPKEGDLFPSLPLRQQMMRFINGLKRPGVEFKFSAPTAVLSDVRGTLQPCGNEEAELVCPFSEDNFLPRGCVLRNTPFILAVAIYVGEDTKTRMNASTSIMKFSNMQVNLNNCVRGLLVCLFSVCLFATIIAFAAQGSLAARNEELIKDARNPIIRFFMFCVTFYHVVPMSLYVIYEMLKLVLAFQVNADKQMYDPVRDEMAKARTAEVMEEMGQVNFLFSDKTGTLTANEMVFARCHVGAQDMGEFRKTSEGEPGPGVVKTREMLLSGKSEDPLFKSLLNLFTCLAVCHSVQALEKESEDGKKRLTFNGMSPDEVALVQIADDVGMSFISRVRKTAGNTSDIIVRGPGTSQRNFTVLHELAFSSDRKRMSVIVKHKGSIWCITKGADSVMEGLLTEPFTEACAADLSTFSRQGLRTLIVGMRTIEQAEFGAWSAEYTSARNLIDDTKEDRMAEVGAQLEKDLKFIGVTAVEDRLQDGVPEAISTIKEAGIRLWVLTGDKTETAVDIAKSCRLFSDDTTMAYAVLAEDAKDAEDKLLKAHSMLDGKKDTGLVLDGQTLLHALANQECRKIIYELGVVSRSCICSRLSPMQKLELVKLVRQQNKMAITLAIGDGANDVPMIQGAHLGIAIRGKEGTQAVQASDIAISYFRFLVPLLLCHGRRSYRRVALFLSFYLYKNVALLMCDIWWMFQDKFRARIAFPEYLSIGFNVLYSAWHILFVLGFDSDIKDEVALARPALYKPGPARQLFNIRIFAQWILFGILQGSIAWVIPFAWIGTTEYDKTKPGQFWICSTAAFTSINIIVCMKLVMHCESPFSKWTILPTAGAFLCYIIVLFCLGYTPPGKSFQPNFWHIPGDLLKSTDALLSIACACAAALFPDAVLLTLERFLWPSELSLAKRVKK